MPTEPFLNVTELHIFLDTNVLLHYPALSDLKWCEIAKVSKVYIHITQPVLDEIAQKKDMGEGKALRKRAAQVTLRLNQILEDGKAEKQLRKNELLILDADTPIMEDYPTLNRLSKDDQLIACILRFCHGHLSSAACVVTSDSSLAFRVKVNKWQINHLTLDPSLRLRDEPDPDEVANQNMRRELHALKTAQPVLAVTFTSGSNQLRFERPFQLKEKVSEFMDAKRKKHVPRYVLPNQGFRGNITRESISMDELHAYNSSLEPFFIKCETWATSTFERLNRAVHIGLKLENSGSVPAKDVLVTLRFPKGIVLHSQKDIKDIYSKMPTPPILRHEAMLQQLGLSHDAFVMEPKQPSLSMFSNEQCSLEIDHAPSNSVRANCVKLRQSHSIKLEPLEALYDKQPFSFQIEYSIVADNMREDVKGKLHVIV